MNIFQRIYKTFLDALYPDKIKCIFCKNDLKNDYPICDECKNKDYFNKGNRCQICDLRIKERNKICDHCKSNMPKFIKAVSPFVYANDVRKSIIKFKSDNAKYLAPPFAKFMYERIKECNINFDIIIPIPSHKDSIKKRGYNQAKVLADEISKLCHKPVMEILIKNVKTKPQKTLNFKQRQENLRDSITLIDRKAVKDKNILLVDDILTTRATVNYCSELLSMAKGVYVCTIARNELKIKK